MDDERLATLERKLSRLQRVTVMLAAGFVLLLVWRLVPPPPVIEAREFRLRDRGGAFRGALGMLDESRPMLRLNDLNGRARALLYLNPERGGTFRLLDQEGESRLALLLMEDGRSEIVMNDPRDGSWTRLAVPSPARPALATGDSAGAIWSSPRRGDGR